jgi:hypothetical protein
MVKLITFISLLTILSPTQVGGCSYQVFPGVRLPSDQYVFQGTVAGVRFDENLEAAAVDVMVTEAVLNATIGATVRVIPYMVMPDCSPANPSSAFLVQEFPVGAPVWAIAEPLSETALDSQPILLKVFPYDGTHLLPIYEFHVQDTPDFDYELNSQRAAEKQSGPYLQL